MPENTEEKREAVKPLVFIVERDREPESDSGFFAGLFCGVLLMYTVYRLAELITPEA